VNDGVDHDPQDERTYRSASDTEMKLTHAQAMWCRFNDVRRCQIEYWARWRAVHEKQSRRPPARCRSELHESENPVSRTTLTKKISTPRPSLSFPSGKSAPNASIHRNVSGMNAKYRKKRCEFWRMNGKRVSIA
jgi:hypothetical protein